MYLTIWTLVVLLICNSGLSSGCNVSGAERCYADMAEALGNGESGMTGMELFTLINPTSDTHQEYQCNALRNHDFTSVKRCVAEANCADTNILPPDLSGPGVPDITWSSVNDYIHGLCQPGCENLATKNQEAAQCGNMAGAGSGGDICGPMDQMFDCFRGVVGKCEVLVSYTESMLEATGMIDMIKQMCPNTNVNLSHGGESQESEESDESEEEGPGVCKEEKVQQCFQSMAEELGLPENQLNNNDLMGLVNPGQGTPDPASIDAEQQRVCSGLADYDMSIVRSCIASSGCADTSLLPPEVAGMPGAPHITWMTIVDLLEGICEPGCENMGTMNQEVQACSAGMQEGAGSDPCGAMDRAFDCFRDTIGRCDVMVSFTNDLLSSTGVLDLVKDYCPNVNFDLSASEDKKRNNNLKEVKNLHKRLNYLTLPTQLNMLKVSKRFHSLNLSKRLNMLKQERAIKALKAYNVHGRH